VDEGVNDLSAMIWGTTHPDLAIGGAYCEVAPIGAKASAVDVKVVGKSGIVIDKHTG
jgi:hypothetical protein